MKSNITIIAVLVFTFLHSLANPIFSQTKPLVIGQSFSFHSNILNEDRMIMVSLPANYNNTEAKYPVLYLLDAETHFNYTAGLLQFLSTNNLMPETILIGITNTDRNRDFTPVNLVTVPNSGGADKFLTFLEQELIPHIEKNYATVPFRTLVGHSLCGMFSFYTLITNPQLFNSAIAISPWLIHNNNFMIDFSKKHFANITSLNKTVYFTAGSLGQPDLLKTIEEFTEILDETAPQDFHWKYTLMQNEDHGSQVLTAIYEGLKFIYDGWPYPQDKLDKGLDAILNHYKKLSEKYGYKISPSEALLNQAGYFFLQKKLIDDAISIFIKNVELYPHSPNVYDSLGEAYENNNDLPNAKKNYDLGYTLANAVNNPNKGIYKANLDRVLEKLNMK